MKDAMAHEVPLSTRRRNMDVVAPRKHYVVFKKHAPEPVWIEVTVVAPRREAIAKARELVASIPGIQYEGTD